MAVVVSGCMGAGRRKVIQVLTKTLYRGIVGPPIVSRISPGAARLPGVPGVTPEENLVQFLSTT